ncbi:MAG TPA: 3-deoxy-8-phosphooctulonate synthase [Chitinophagales bacterium]|nr:3-deoxy-8-phosphooctulonate synthase [Chitinophagales bacterium]HMV03687.1 3-deoxy-8-phosphooctulonate synthase [Chitinophagales bacterium]HMW95457.1 3-deoxy-8-phosphooctulonate synthase [Chitinophagales bacterium]HMY43605.1 3-deoxy-8-phosphooctulonate synthase [Chitinophagales bacterium]HMZ69678.1 3-deoxy-8-phosphooctulonate synthase [Chitinophagales bacterium]
MFKLSNFFLIAGPCVVENQEIGFEVAETLVSITQKLNIPFYFKASFKKANRTSIHSFSTIGETKALQILADIKSKYQVQILTDVHESSDIEKVKDIVDVIQIPAFLCRQTDLILAAAKTEKIINIKKGQFANAIQMQFAADKVRSVGNDNIWLTERGNSFGYQDLVVDFRNIPLLKTNHCKAIIDITHSIQQPNSTEGKTLGTPEFIELIAKCGIVAGADGLFLETHPNPSNALSDGSNMIALNKVENLLSKLQKIAAVL